MAATRTRRPAAEAPAKLTVYEGQLDEQRLRELIRERGEQAAARRLKWLAENPGWIACSVQGCSGLVRPQYQRKAPNGELWGLCPRRQAHLRLAPNVFTRPEPAA